MYCIYDSYHKKSKRSGYTKMKQRSCILTYICMQGRKVVQFKSRQSYNITDRHSSWKESCLSDILKSFYISFFMLSPGQNDYFWPPNALKCIENVHTGVHKYLFLEGRRGAPRPQAQPSNERAISLLPCSTLTSRAFGTGC